MKTKKQNTKAKELGRFNVAGVQYSDYQKLSNYRTPTPVKFFWERHNKYDDKAIRIEYEGVKIGYVPRGSIQNELHELRENKISVEGILTAYNKNNPSWYLFTVAYYAYLTLPKKVEYSFDRVSGFEKHHPDYTEYDDYDY